MIEFFFDCSSPWTYLAFSNIQPLATQYNVPIVWRPVLVGGIFNAVNPSVYNNRNDPVPAKQRYGKKDLQDWARSAGLKIKMPPTVFPVNAVKSMRGCILLDKEGKLLPFATACFEAYWATTPISEGRRATKVCQRVGISPKNSLPDRRAASERSAQGQRGRVIAAAAGFMTMSSTRPTCNGNDRLPLLHWLEVEAQALGVQSNRP